MWKVFCSHFVWNGGQYRFRRKKKKKRGLFCSSNYCSVCVFQKSGGGGRMYQHIVEVLQGVPHIHNQIHITWSSHIVQMDPYLTVGGQTVLLLLCPPCTAYNIRPITGQKSSLLRASLSLSSFHPFQPLTQIWDMEEKERKRGKKMVV